LPASRDRGRLLLAKFAGHDRDTADTKHRIVLVRSTKAR
jgi:hypothetical protein